MKNACFLLLTIGLAALMYSYGASSPLSKQASAEAAAKPVSSQAVKGSQSSPADSAKDQKNASTLNERGGSRDVLKRNLMRVHPDLSKTKRLPVPGSKRRSRPSSAITVLRSGSAGPGIAKGLVQARTPNNVPVRSPSISPATPTSITGVRHRNSNPAMISGSAQSKARNGMVLKCTDMGRRR